MTSRTYLFAGGGTGGHLFPGIAVAQELQQREANARIVFVGSEKELEQSILARYGFEHRSLPVESLHCLKRRPWQFVIRNWRAWREARKLIRDERPAAVIGLGGYASAPVVWAATRARIPVILLEQNVIPGRTTRWLAKSAKIVCLAFEETASRLPPGTCTAITGNPVRPPIAAMHSSPPAKRTSQQLLVLGGSQGADSLNQAVTVAVETLHDELSGWTIVHQTGPRQVDQVRHAYEELSIRATVEPFFEDLADRYQDATLVISRAGATTLAELTCCSLPMVLLPYPQAADNHQKANAICMYARGAAVIVEHGRSSEVTGQQLARQLKSLLSDAGSLTSMSHAAHAIACPDAARDVASVLGELVSAKTEPD